MSSAAVESRTYWCHECDMSVSLLCFLSSPSPSPSPVLCPHCDGDFLEQMDSSPTTASSAAAEEDFQLDSPYLLRLIQHLSDLDDSASVTALRGPFSASRASVEAIATVEVTSSMLAADPVLLCAICKDQFVVGLEARKLPCSHLYHADCILPWLLLHNSCPLCRFCLPTEDDSRRERMEAAGVRFGELAAGEDWFGFQDTLRHIERRQRQVVVESSISLRASSVEAISSWPVEGAPVSGGHGGYDDDEDNDEEEDGDAVMAEVQVSTASVPANEVHI